MTEVTTERATAKRRNGRDVPVLVSGNALAAHLCMTRQNVALLVVEGIIERVDGKFDQDQCRLRYIKHMRSDARRSPRTQADADHVKVKTEMLQLRLMERRRELVRQDDVTAMFDQVCGIMLTALSGLPARCSRDPAVRRNIELVTHQVRIELA